MNKPRCHIAMLHVDCIFHLLSVLINTASIIAEARARFLVGVR